MTAETRILPFFKQLYFWFERGRSGLLRTKWNNSIKFTGNKTPVWMHADDFGFKRLYHFPTEDPFLKECEGLSPMSR